MRQATSTTPVACRRAGSGRRRRSSRWSGDDRSATRARARGGREPSTVIIECKRSRQDFFRDGADLEALLERRATLVDERRDVEQTRVRRAEPHLRRSGTSLFPELEDWDFASSRLPAYRRILQGDPARRDGDLRAHEIRHAGSISAGRQAVHPGPGRDWCVRHECPLGWGLVECPRPRLRRHGDVPGELDDLPLRLTDDAVELALPWRGASASCATSPPASPAA